MNEIEMENYIEKVLKRPMEHWGRKWQKWMDIEHHVMAQVLRIDERWHIIACEVDELAFDRYFELADIYQKNHPRPKTFEETRIWAKAKQIELERAVMIDIVCIYRDEVGFSIDLTRPEDE